MPKAIKGPTLTLNSEMEDIRFSNSSIRLPPTVSLTRDFRFSSDYRHVLIRKRSRKPQHPSAPAFFPVFSLKRNSSQCKPFHSVAFGRGLHARARCFEGIVTTNRYQNGKRTIITRVKRVDGGKAWCPMSSAFVPGTPQPPGETCP